MASIFSREKFEDLSAPHTDAKLAVDDWLTSMGFDVNGLVRSALADWVKVKTTVQKAEEMLNTVMSP